jgi:RHH-type rel operon transcriptional repressor/antitoxin RelB
VTHFAGHIGSPVKNLSVYNDTGAQSRPESEKDEVANRRPGPAGSEAPFREGTRVAVVLDMHRKRWESLRQTHLQIDVVPTRQVRRIEKQPLPDPQRAANGDAQRHDFAPCFACFADQLCHEIRYGRKPLIERAMRLRRNLAAPVDLAIEAALDARDFCSSDVKADERTASRGRRHQRIRDAHGSTALFVPSKALFELFDNLIRVFLWTGNHSNRNGHKQHNGEQQVSHRGLLSQLQNKPIDFDAIASGDGSRPSIVVLQTASSGTVAMSVRLDPTLETRVEQESRRLGVTKSEFVKDALERVLGLKNPADLLSAVRSGKAMGNPQASRNVSARMKAKLRAKLRCCN